MLRQIIFFTAILSIPAIGLSQTTWYVPDDFPSGIQTAIANASVEDGDTIVVRPGTYYENIDYLGKAITIRSEHGPAVTTIDGNQSGSVVVFQNGEGKDSVIDGFTVTNGSGTYWLGIYRGGGIYCKSYSSLNITNNIISGNRAEHGGGIYTLFGSFLIENNTISGNKAYVSGGGIFCTTCSAIINNNTITENSIDDVWGGGIALEQSTLTITNTILWNNRVDTYIPAQQIYLFCGSLSVTYCDVMRNWPGTGNIDEDPLFLDPLNGDFHLSNASPCIDTGDNIAIPSWLKTDFEGDPRIIQGLSPGYGKGVIPLGGPGTPGIVDIGADEYCRIKYRNPKNSVQ